MASTGINNATLIALYVDVSGTITKIAHLVSNDFDFSRAAIDVSTKDSAGYQDSIYGQANWAMNGEGNFAEDASYGFEELLAAAMSKEVLTVRMSSEVSGDKYFEGSVLVTNVKTGGSSEDKQTFSASFTGTGAITVATKA